MLLGCAAAALFAPYSHAQLPLPPSPLPAPTPPGSGPPPPPARPGPSSSEAPDVASVSGVSVRRDNYLADDTLAPPLRKAWTYDLGAKAGYPLIAEDRIFVMGWGPAEARIHALDRASGRPIWTKAIPGGGLTAYDAGRIFVYNSDRIFALSTETGEQLWSYAASSPSGFTVATPIAARGLVFFSSNGSFHALDAATGELRWRAANLRGSGTHATLDGNRVYSAESCANARAFDMFSGNQAWERRTGCSGGGFDTPRLHAGRLYLTEEDDVLDAATGAAVGKLPRSGAPVFAGDTTVLALEGGTILARRGPAGPEQWRVLVEHEGDGTGYGLSGAGGWVYVIRSGRLQALALETGERAAAPELYIPNPTTGGGSADRLGMAAGQGVLAVPNTNQLEVWTSALAPAPGGLESLPRTTDVLFGKSLALDGRLGTELRGGGRRTVRVEYDPAPDGGVTPGGTTSSRGDGTFTLRATPSRNSRIRAVVPGGPASQPHQVYVYPRLGFSGRAISPSRARLRVRLSGPKTIRLAGRRVHVYLLREGAKRARRMGGGTLRRERAGQALAVFTVRIPSNVGERDQFVICSPRLSRAGLGRPDSVDRDCGRTLIRP